MGGSPPLYHWRAAADTLCQAMRYSMVLLALGWLTGCAGPGVVYVPQPFPRPGGGVAAGHGPGRADGSAVTLTALGLRGRPYRDGGATPAGFDCSGFVFYVFGQHGIALPRPVADQFRVGTPVERHRLRPGDLVFFSTGAPGPSHVGVALGDDQFIHAPSSRGVVRVERLSSAYWEDRFVGAKRLFVN